MTSPAGTKRPEALAAKETRVRVRLRVRLRVRVRVRRVDFFD